MAELFSPSLVGAMDRLWFHQLIIFSQPISLFPSDTFSHEPSHLHEGVIFHEEVEFFRDSNLSSLPKDNYCNNEEQEEQEEEETPTRMNSNDQSEDALIQQDKYETNEEQDRPRSRTPPPSTRTHQSYQNIQELQRTKSCKSLHELELEEVQGFMDLGFKFEKDKITPRMMSVIPGLQRLDEGQESKFEEEDSSMAEGQNGKRAYLSEAWMIKRPNSPLLRLRMGRVSTTADDMKKNLKIWARTVAAFALSNQESH